MDASLRLMRSLATLCYSESIYDVPEAGIGKFLEEELGEDEDEDSKPVRVLSDFVIFDPRHDNELVSLDEIEKSDATMDREFEGAGNVRPLLEDEDEDQDDDVEGQQDVVRLRLSAILRYWTDYKEDSA